MADAAKGSISSSQQDDKYRQKIDELAKKIEKIREEKMQCSPVANIKRSIASSKVDHSKKLKKGLHHPHLELIMYELAHSPFLTPPVQTYSDSTLHLNEDVKKIRQKKEFSKIFYLNFEFQFHRRHRMVVNAPHQDPALSKLAK